MTTPDTTSTTPPPSLAMPPTTPGKYTLLAELGRGGMATAYLAAMQGPGGFNKLMVVKRLRAALATEPEFLRMFLQEARLAARIDHPNVVHTTEVGFDGEDYFIAMEYIEGQSLENVSRRVLSRAAGISIAPPPSSTSASSAHLGATPTITSAIGVLGAMIPLPIHLFILTQVLAGLDYAHELKDFDGNALNVVHRDISPHNVMVTYEGHVKLVDFGIAKAADSNGDTRTGVMKGKCAYMPAEQFGGKVDRRADIFAVGVMLWQALTGRRLWKGLSDAEVFQRLARDDVPTPSSVRDDINPELEAICMKALSFRPDDRFSTAADMQSAIEDVIATDRSLRASPRETGKYVAEMFTTDREKVRRVVEEELGSRSSSGSTEVQHLPRIGSTTSSMPSSSIELLRSAPAVANDPEPPPPAPRRTTRIAVIGAVALGAALTLVFALRGPAAREAGNTPALASGAASALLPASDQAASKITLATTPATAKVFVDGAQLGAEHSFDRDGKRHMVSMEADGYEVRTEWVVFDHEKLEWTLAKVDPVKPSRTGGRVGPVRGGGGKPAAPDAPPEPEKAQPAPAASKKGMGLDTGDPWAK